MTSVRIGRRLNLALVGTAVSAVALAGCGGGSSGGASTTVAAGGSSSVDAALAAKVPASVKADGKITVGVDPTYSPNEFLGTDGKTVMGWDVDLFNAVAAKLGLTVTWVPSSFDSIIPGVSTAQKYEVGVSSFTINADRMKQVNMVSYFSAGTQWASQQGNPTGITPDNACGKRIAVQKATVQVDDLTARSKTCTGAGKPAITIDQYDGQDTATAAVVTGKDVAMLADSPVCAYAVKQTNGKLVLLGDIYDSAPYGYVVPKDQTDFASALAGAVTDLINDGTYTQVLTKWGVEAGKITTPAVNPPVS